MVNRTASPRCGWVERPPGSPNMAAEPRPVKALFLAALAKEGRGERAAFLEQACAGNDGLRRQVEALLRNLEEADSLQDQRGQGPEVEGQPTTPSAAADSGPPLPTEGSAGWPLGDELPPAPRPLARPAGLPGVVQAL